MEADEIKAVMKPASKRILIVDDDKDVLEVLVEAFVEDGWKAYKASNGVLALQIMETEKFDAILTDLSMPRMDGIEFLGHAKASVLNKRARFFIVSGALDADKIKRVTSIGVASIIVKPFEAHVVVQKINEKCEAVALAAGKPKTTVSYDANIIRAIAASMQEVAKFYLGKDVLIAKPYIKSSKMAKGYFSAIISLSQDASIGSIAFTSNPNFLKKLSESIFGETQNGMNDEMTRDLAGEMCNQISGKIKINFAKIDYFVNIGLPLVVVGENHSISHPGNSPVIAIPMTSDEYSFCLEFTMNGALKKGRPEGTVTEEAGSDLTSGALFF